MNLWDRYTSKDVATKFGVDIRDGRGGVGQWGVWHLGNDIVIRVTLDHRGRKEEYRYRDEFIDDRTLVWYSQLSVGPDSRRGRDYLEQDERRLVVHVFARGEKRRGTATLPFYYLGTARREHWDGSKPMRIRWKLENGIPRHLWATFGVPQGSGRGLPDPEVRLETLDEAASGELNEVRRRLAAGDHSAPDEWTLSRRRAGQALFRERVIEDFHQECAVCGLREKRLLDACHIVPWRQDAENRLNPDNGIALCCFHHRAFDAGLLRITAAGDVKVVSHLLEGGDFVEKSLQIYHGRRLGGVLEGRIPFLRQMEADAPLTWNEGEETAPGDVIPPRDP